MKDKIFAFTFAASVFVSVIPAHAIPVVLDSVAAGFAREGALTGISPFVVEIGNSADLSFEDRGIVEFDIGSSGVQAPASAVLRLFNGHVLNGLTTPYNVDIYGYAGNGVLEQNDFALGTFLTTVSVTGTILTANVSNFVNSIHGSSAFVGFNLRMQFQPGQHIAQFDSLAEGVILRPFVHVPTLSFNESDSSSLPGPGAIALLGFGLACIGLQRRTSPETV